jgi:hypothetical protein
VIIKDLAHYMSLISCAKSFIITFNYIEVFYNLKLRRAFLGNLNQIVYEEIYEIKQERTSIINKISVHHSFSSQCSGCRELLSVLSY